MTAEEIFIKLRDELTAENESSSSPERIFIKSEGQTICTLGMNRSHEIIFVEFKPASKDLAAIEREAFVHPHPVEMLHDAGWRQAQLTAWEEAEKLLEIIQRSYKRKKPRSDESRPRRRQRGKEVPQIAARKLPVSAPTNKKEKKAAAAKPKTLKKTQVKKPAHKKAARPKKAVKASSKKKAAKPAKKKRR